jgi:hypothetical protein
LAGLTNFATTGTWVSCNFICTGEANFECDNGYLDKVIFYYPTNSVARSKALTSPITYWAFADSQATIYGTTLTKTAIRSTISWCVERLPFLSVEGRFRPYPQNHDAPFLRRNRDIPPNQAQSRFATKPVDDPKRPHHRHRPRGKRLQFLSQVLGLSFFSLMVAVGLCPAYVEG